MVRDNVTFIFRIDSAKAQETLRQLEAQVRKLGGTAVKTSQDMGTLNAKVQDTGVKAAASAVNFQTATQGMLNLSTAAVQTFTSISNLDRAHNRAKMSVIAVARAEDLLNNKKERLNQLTQQGITSGNKYTNLQREIATAEADLTVKIEKRGIEQAAVNDIYMLFATNVANVTISSMQTLAILDKNQILLTKAKTAALKISNFFHMDQVRISAATAKAKFIEANMTGLATGAINKQTLAVKGLTASVRAFMASNPVTLGLMVASTAAFAIHETNILGTKTALDELIGVEKDFQSQVKEGRDGIDAYDDSISSLGSTLNSDLPTSFQEAAKVIIRFNQLLSESEQKAISASVAVEQFQGSMSGGPRKRGGTFIPRPTPPQTQKPQVQQGRGGTGRPHFRTPSQGGQNQALANALTATGDFLMADPFAGSKAYAQEVGKQTVPTTISTQTQEKKITQGFELQDVRFLDRTTTDIPSDESIANELGVDLETLRDAVRTQGISAYRLLLAHRISKGDFLSIFEAKALERLEKGTTQIISPEMQMQQNIINEAIRIDKNFAQEFRKKYTAVAGISVDKLLFEMGELEPERRKRFEKEGVFIAGVGKVSPDEVQNIKLAQTLQAGPLADAVNFAGITNLQDEITKTQYVRLLAAKKGVGKNFTLTAKEQGILDKIQKGLIKGKRAEVLINTGEDIGAVANTIDIKSGLRLGALQESLRKYNRTSADPFVSDFERLSKTQQAFALQDRPSISFTGLLDAKKTEEIRAKFRQGAPDPYGISTRQFSDVLRSSSLETQRASVFRTPGIGGRADQVIADLEAAGQQFKTMAAVNNLLSISGAPSSVATFGTGFFKSTGATAAYQVPRGSVRASQAFYDRIRIRDENTNRLRWGGKLREGMSIEDEGAVVGGYSSAKEFSRAGKRKQFEAWDQAQLFADWFSGIGRVSSYTGKSDLRGQLGGIKQRADTIKNALSSAGLGYKRFNARTGLRYRYTMAEYNRFHKEWNAVKSFNDNQYAKARQINLLQEGFGLSGFTGSALTLPSLQQEVARQDELMRSIGLDRTEAFQIVDTEGRGREEIDDRIRFKDRMNSMSTGVSVL